MKIVVAYASAQGCPGKSVALIRRLLDDNCDTFNLDSGADIDLDGYETVIIGGPIRFGRMTASVQRFCQNHLAALLQRRVGLFICSMQGGGAALQELQQAFPAELLAHAGATGIFGGEIHLERISFIERFIVRAVVRTEYNVTTFSEERVSRFLRQLLAG